MLMQLNILMAKNMADFLRMNISAKQLPPYLSYNLYKGTKRDTGTGGE